MKMRIAALALAAFLSTPLLTSALTQQEKTTLLLQLIQKVLELNQKLVALGGTAIQLPPGLASLTQQPQQGSTCTISRTLSLGMRGDDVSCLQTFLIQQGLLAPENATGYFGHLTQAAVASLQRSRGLEPVGYVGRLTRAIVNTAPPAAPPVTTPPAGGGSTPPPPPAGGGGGGGGGGTPPPPPPSPQPPLPGDTTTPTVLITAPAASSTVSGTVSITTNASDNVGVVGVQFKLDNQNLGAEDTTVPYSVSWNTASTTNGAHTITAVARDATGNRATSAISVTVNNLAAITPTISVLYPARFVPGTPVTIGGTGFDATHNVIHISGPTEQNFVALGVQNGTLLTFTFPSTAPAGAYTLTVNNGTKTSAPFAFTAVDMITPPATPSAASAQSFLTISPNPCILDGAGKCTTVVHWETPATATMLWASKNGAAPVLVVCQGKNGTSTISWITSGNSFEFSLYAVSSCATKPASPAGLDWLAAVSTTGISNGVLVYPASNIGMEHIFLFTEYLGHQGVGFQGTDAEAVVETAWARKKLDDAKMLTGANYVRVGPTGWWPQDLALWLHNPDAYWKLMDTMMHDLHGRGLAITPYFNLHHNLFPALTDETIGDFYGNSQSASYQLYIRYVREFITRYKNDPQVSIYFYIIGGESNNGVDLDGRSLKCGQFSGWLCATAGNFSTNQLNAFQSRVASYIRTLDPTHPITSGNSVARSAAYHLERRPAWAGGPDWTPDSKAELKQYLAYISQGLDLVELHFYNVPRAGVSTHDNERFCPGPDCISGVSNADLLDVYVQVADEMGKKVYIGEYGDHDPFLKDSMPNFGNFYRNVLDKTTALRIPYTIPWAFEFYTTRTSTYSQQPSYDNIEPGYTDSLISYIRNSNMALGSISAPIQIPIPLVEVVLTNPLDGAALSGTSTLLYSVASAPRVGASIQSVKFSVDGTVVSTTTKPPYQFTLQHATLTAGMHTIQATALDTAGNTASSNTVTITCTASVCTK